MLEQTGPRYLRFASKLPDGTPLLFRAIEPGDKDRLVRGFAALSPEARYRRFLTALSTLSAEQVVYLTEIDYVNHFAWVALLRDEPGQPGIAVGRWVRLPHEPAIAEIAITVIDPYQGQGVGHTLLWLSVRAAIQNGIKGFRVYTLGDNHSAMRLLRRVGGMTGEWESGVYAATAELPSSVEELERLQPPLPLEEPTGQAD